MTGGMRKRKGAARRRRRRRHARALAHLQAPACQVCTTRKANRLRKTDTKCARVFSLRVVCALTFYSTVCVCVCVVSFCDFVVTSRPSAACKMNGAQRKRQPASQPRISGNRAKLGPAVAARTETFRQFGPGLGGGACRSARAQMQTCCRSGQ